MRRATKPTVEEMAAHIVSEVRYDMRHGNPLSLSRNYTERRIKELLADVYAEAIEKAAMVAQYSHEDGACIAFAIRALAA